MRQQPAVDRRQADLHNLPMKLEPLGTLPGSFSIAGTTADLVYLAGREDEHLLTIVRLAGGAPSVAGTIKGERGAAFKAVAGGRAYLAGEDGGVTLLDVTDPKRAAKLGSLATQRPIWHVAIDDARRIAVVSDLASVRTADVSDPKSP